MTVDVTTGVTTLIAVLTGTDSDVTGLDFGVINGNTVVFAVDSESLYLVDIATAVCTKVGTGTGHTALSGLAYDPLRPDMVWGVTDVSVSGATADYRLTMIKTSASLMWAGDAVGEVLNSSTPADAGADVQCLAAVDDGTFYIIDENNTMRISHRDG